MGGDELDREISKFKSEIPNKSKASNSTVGVGNYASQGGPMF
jgi:hypothetical protein